MKTPQLFAAFAVLAVASLPLRAQNTDSAALTATVEALRTGGTTLTAWLLDSGGDRTFLDRVDTIESFDWSACPSITLEEARRRLGAAQGAKLSERDGWGHRIEYCLRSDGSTTSTHAVGVRSPGRDGRFDASPYVPAGFDPSQPDHDLVWMDGIFVTAPARAK
jgi:hypothetical protein